MLTDPDQIATSREVSRLIHEKQFRKASQTVADACGMKVKIESERPRDYLPPLQLYLHWLLNNGGMSEAAQILWTPTQFDPRPQSTQDVWKLFENTSQGIVMGAASMSKSFSAGVRYFLEWVRDPEWTTVRVIGPSEDHLETNLFSHLVSLHQQASMPMPGKVGSLFIGMDRRNLTSSIKGLVIPVGHIKKAGRLQGTKRKPRPHPHPIFGERSRLFVFMDEVENIPTGVWADVDNILANSDETSCDGFKVLCAYNPSNQFHEVGQRAEPPTGWRDFDVDRDFNWKSKRGWSVLRLDGERSENVKQGRVVFPGLQTQAGLDLLAKNSGGKQSAGYMTFGRGAYPTQGTEMTVIPPGMLEKSRGEFIWFDTPRPCGSVDMALLGGALAVFTLGKFGLATGIKWPPSLKHPTGHTEMFKNAQGSVTPRIGVQADQQFPLPKGETVAMKNAVVDMAKRAGIAPECLCMDRTGNGAGVHDLVMDEWSTAVIGVNYSSGPTEQKIMEESDKPKKNSEGKIEQAFDRIDSELWFAFRAFCEFTVLLLNPAMDLSKITPQLTERRYRVVGGKNKVESKKDFKDRGNDSPDEADSLTLFVHAARIGGRLIPAMRGGAGNIDPGDDDWWDGNYYENGVRIDPSNQNDSLEVANGSQD